MSLLREPETSASRIGGGSSKGKRWRVFLKNRWKPLQVDFFSDHAEAELKLVNRGVARIYLSSVTARRNTSQHTVTDRIQ